MMAGDPVACILGTHERDFMHVFEAGAALAVLVDSNRQGPVNLGSGGTVTVKLVATLGRLADRPELLRFRAGPTNEGQPMRLAASTKVLREEIGFHHDSGLKTAWRRRWVGGLKWKQNSMQTSSDIPETTVFEATNELQFDLFARYSMLAAIVRTVSKPDLQAALIDIGAGISRLTERFLPDHFGKIVRTDIEDFGDAGITVVPTGEHLPFDDGSFACAVAMDVLEHMPDDARASFMGECLRVAPRLAIIATPIGLPIVSAAESVYAEGYRCLFSQALAFLDEHTGFGLPNPEKIASVAVTLGAEVVTVDSVRLPEWLATNLIDLYFSTINDGGAAKRFMARRLAESFPIAGTGQHYRRFYVLTRDPDIAKALRATFPPPESTTDSRPLEDAALILAKQFRDYVAAYDAPFIAAERADLAQSIDYLRGIIAAKDAHIVKLNELNADISAKLQALNAQKRQELGDGQEQNESKGS